MKLCWLNNQQDLPLYFKIIGLPAKIQKSKPSPEKKKIIRRKKDLEKMKKSRSSPSHLTNLQDSDEERENNDYHSLSIQVIC